MRYGVGIDLGTSFTSAAVHAEGVTRMVPLSPDLIIPSVAYAAPDGTLLTGETAENAARVEGGGGRVARGFKRRLGDPTPLVLGGVAYSPAALMAAQLRAVLHHVTAVEGEPPTSVVLTCPAIWGPYRREHFTEVPRLAGVPVSQLITEPEAAAAHYSLERRLGDGEVVAVYDLGGGTFDSTILRSRPGGMEILGTPEGIEHLGGVDFDEALVAHLDDRLDGAISALDRTDPVAATALAEIRAMCVRAKEELSTEPDIELSVPLPSGPRALTVTRVQLNEMIRPSVQLTIDGLRRTIASAGLRSTDLSAILLAGGSSRIPLVWQLVHEEFGKPVQTTLHPKFTVALGAAATVTHPGAEPVEPAVSSPPRGFPIPARRRRWLVPTVTAVVVALAAVTTLFLTTGGGGAQENPPVTEASTAAGESGPPKILWVYDNGPVTPYHSLIASAENWQGTDFGAEGASHSPITATPEGPNGIRATWSGGSPGQLYLQDIANGADMTVYLRHGGALVFDTVVHTPPASTTKVAVHCVYPCVAEVEGTNLFRGMPVEQKTTVRIPLTCFVDNGLNARIVDTPFLVYTTGAFDATFSAVRWEPGAVDTIPCTDLT